MDRPFLQSDRWLAFQESLGRSVWRFENDAIRAGIIRHDVRLGQHWLSIPYGPEIRLGQAHEGLKNTILQFRTYLHDLARRERSMFVKLEPVQDVVVELLYQYGVPMRTSPHPLQPMRTMVIELEKSADDLLNGLHHKHRYNINLAERKGVSIEESQDFEAFWELLHRTARQDGFRTHDKLYYKKLLNFFSSGNPRTRLVFAVYGGKPIAAALMLEYDTTAYYLHGASDREHRSLMAPHLLHWKNIQQYKEQGYQWYDFWGVDSARWPGVTRFKLGFGGRVIEYPGSFDLVQRPFMRWLYNTVPR